MCIICWHERRHHACTAMVSVHDSTTASVTRHHHMCCLNASAAKRYTNRRTTLASYIVPTAHRSSPISTTGLKPITIITITSAA